MLLERGLRRDGGVNWGVTARRTERGETCVTGMMLSLACYFGLDDARLDTVAEHLLGEQMPDGGWNCQRARGATHASVHTTILALEGLRQYELHGGAHPSWAGAAQARGREFLLVHRLFRSHRTGAVIHPQLTRFFFPPRWHYDILRALDHFQAVAAPRDERLAEAIAVVRERRGPDGRWRLPAPYPGRTFFELERPGQPSRWNTLRALRVLRWWEAGDAPGP